MSGRGFVNSADDFVNAARVPDSLETQSFGLWDIRRMTMTNPYHRAQAGFDTVTFLQRWTYSTLHLGAGETVMEDSEPELRRHLPIWMIAHGRVLVTGLGLGCVVRGLLANGSVEKIDVVEIDHGIARVIGSEFASNPRVNLHVADALEWQIGDRKWDFAWHDIWSDTDAGKPHLQVLHGKLIARFHPNVANQGAWALPRKIARKLKVRLIGTPNYRRDHEERAIL